MAKMSVLEPLVEKALRFHPETRGDNFLLYNQVLKHYIDTTAPIRDVFENHVSLGIPSLESITRCRRKIQERDPSLRPEESVQEARKAEESAYIDYANSGDFLV